MGNLTNSVKMLAREIGALREARLSLLETLAAQTAARRESVSAMCTAFARERAKARNVWQRLYDAPAPAPLNKAMPVAPPPPSPKQATRSRPKPAASPAKAGPAAKPLPKAPKLNKRPVAAEPAVHVSKHAAKGRKSR